MSDGRIHHGRHFELLPFPLTHDQCSGRSECVVIAKRTVTVAPNWMVAAMVAVHDGQVVLEIKGRKLTGVSEMTCF